MATPKNGNGNIYKWLLGFGFTAAIAVGCTAGNIIGTGLFAHERRITTLEIFHRLRGDFQPNSGGTR